MRKKPDILLLLSVLVVSGVIISNYFVIGHSKNTNNLSQLNAQYSPFQTDKDNHTLNRFSSKDGMMPELNSRELARIDSSKQRIR